jgi:hypothetical protein
VDRDGIEKQPGTVRIPHYALSGIFDISGGKQ